MWHRNRPPVPFEHLPQRPEFSVASADFFDGDVLPLAHVFDAAGGQNRSPQLSWWGFPENTRGFAITCFDPDAPSLSGWWHWLVTDLPADCTALDNGAGDSSGADLPVGARQFRNDYGTRDFGGAAPPTGDHHHRYLFTVYALDTDDLGLPDDPSAAVVSFTINAHTLARATISATFAH